MWYVFCNFALYITYIMKIRVFLCFAFTLIILNSCNLDTASSYTPAVYVNSAYNQHGDSMRFYLTDTGGEIRMDSIFVGDTITIAVVLNAFGNNLTAFYISQSTTANATIVLPKKEELDSIFVAGSDYNAGKFIMKGNSPLLYFPLKYIAKSVSADTKITFKAVSDAKFDFGFGSNSDIFTLRTPIKPAKINPIITK